MKVALLGPVAWRTPPRAYGPWETVVSLLAEGLVARGVDVTLFATLDSRDHGHAGRRLPAAVQRGPGPRRAGLGGAAHRATASSAARSSTWCTTTWTGCRWPCPGCAAAPMLTTIHGFGDRRILPAYQRVRVGLRVHLGRRPVARARPTWPPCTTASTCPGWPVATRRRTTIWWRSAGSTRTRRPPTPSRSPGGSGGHCSSADRSRTRRTSPSGSRPHVDGDPVRYLGNVGGRGAGPGAGPGGRAAAPARLRRAVRAVRGRGDGLRHAGGRLPARRAARDRHRRRHRLPGRRCRRRRRRRRPAPSRWTGPRSPQTARRRFSADRMVDDYLAVYETMLG